MSVVSVAVTLGLFAVAQDAVNTTRNAAEQRGTLNENGPLTRFLRKPAVGANANLRANSQLRASAHIYQFATADYPGASFTETMASSNGVTVGNYSFGSLTQLVPFTLKGGVYRTLIVPGAASARAFSVNSVGQIVGDYIDTAGVRHGFVDTAGTFTTIDFPGSVDTTVTDINANGDMVGRWQDETIGSGGGAGEGRQHGFLLQGGVFTSLDYPKADLTMAFGINQSGEVVGVFQTNIGGNNGFTYQGGVFTPLNAPLATATTLFGVNDSGEISGSYRDADDTDHGLLFQNGIFSTVTVTGAAGTTLTHIPNKGSFGANYTDQSGEGHGATGK